MVQVKFKSSEQILQRQMLVSRKVDCSRLSPPTKTTANPLHLTFSEAFHIVTLNNALIMSNKGSHKNSNIKEKTVSGYLEFLESNKMVVNH